MSLLQMSCIDRWGGKAVAMSAFLFPILGLVALVAPAQAASVSGDAMTPVEAANALMLSNAKIFTLFFVMLGPVKLLGPFAKLSAGLDNGQMRKLALSGIGIAILAGIAAAFIGQAILKSWGVALPALLLAVALVLLLVALQSVLVQYSATGVTPATEDRAALHRGAALSPLAFPYIITPYGIAAFILLMAASDVSRDLTIFAIFLLVMVLNFFTMLFARPILKYGAGVLQIIGAVLSVLQVALSIQLFLTAGRMLGIL